MTDPEPEHVVRWRYTQSVLVIPPGCTAELPDGRTVEGPVILMEPATLEAEAAS